VAVAVAMALAVAVSRFRSTRRLVPSFDDG